MTCCFYFLFKTYKPNFPHSLFNFKHKKWDNYRCLSEISHILFLKIN